MVDKDLDFQTMKEFNSFRKDSVDGTSNTKALVDQLTDDTKLIVTTVQKLNNAVTKKAYAAKLNTVASDKMVFIFDAREPAHHGVLPQPPALWVHGDAHFRGECLHDLGKRTTRDGDWTSTLSRTPSAEKVLPFGVEYIGRYRDTSRTFVDIDVEAIDTAEVLNSEKRIAKVVDYIVAHHDAKTFNRDFTAIDDYSTCVSHPSSRTDNESVRCRGLRALRRWRLWRIRCMGCRIPARSS